MNRLIVFLLILIGWPAAAASAKGEGADLYRQPIDAPSRNVLTETQWERVDRSIEIRGWNSLFHNSHAMACSEPEKTASRVLPVCA